MTEKEKMRRLMLHDCFESEICDDRFAAYDLCFELNRLPPSEFGKRQELLGRLLPNAARPIRVLSPFQCEFGYNIYMGEGCTANYGLIILDNAKVTFGHHVFIGPRCIFTTAVHPLSAEKRRTNRIYAFPITVGDSVWFGTDVKVLAGVTIGDGAVIGGGSVVCHDIPPRCLAAGNPARVIRTLDEDIRVGR